MIVHCCVTAEHHQPRKIGLLHVTCIARSVIVNTDWTVQVIWDRLKHTS